ncbi:DEAD/DEAH box helicase [Roseiconus lacunae]|uniref:DEAD/DEAH box helicase n=1 Tax=Roseiconus lacunae TaxID=2605694 RepID=UPI00308A97AA|nr:DEAD/DEAH box helicase [Stieleria sp. HD01]
MDLFVPLQRALAEQSNHQPTPIQIKSIPPAIEGLGILGCAQTGTGKTAALALPILDYIGREQRPVPANQPVALVLAPTRELAIQIADSFCTYGKHMRFCQALVYGGVGQAEQIKALRRGVHVLIATPGRLLDLMDQGHVDFSDVEIFVLDEADRMLDMGFMPSLNRIVAELPRQRQSLFFSATLPLKIRELAAKLLFNPVSVTLSSKTTTVERIEQSVRFVRRESKLALLSELLSSDGVDRAIVFTRTKHGANRLANKLDRAGIRATAIHGNKTQNARQRALNAFRDNRVTVLVATDVAARGIDIDGVTHVINYDMPVDPESYVHRIGRTARAGANGIAVSFCTADEMGELRDIERLMGANLEIENAEVRPQSGGPERKKQVGPHETKRDRRSAALKSQSRNGTQHRFRRVNKKHELARANSRQFSTIA